MKSGWPRGSRTRANRVRVDYATITSEANERGEMAGTKGFEPLLSESKSPVLPVTPRPSGECENGC